MNIRAAKRLARPDINPSARGFGRLNPAGSAGSTRRVRQAQPGGFAPETQRSGFFAGLGGLLLFVFLLLAGGGLALAGGAAASGEWETVRAGSLGFSLRVPPGSAAELFLLEQLLRLRLPGEQTVLVKRWEKPAAQTLEVWLDEQFHAAARRGVDPQVTMFPRSSGRALVVGGAAGLVYEIYGPVWVTRRVALAQGDVVWVLDFPLTGETSGLLWAQIVASFSPIATTEDSGVLPTRQRLPVQIAEIPAPLYRQNDPAWGCDQIGTCWCWYGACYGFTGIADAGCFITSEAMVFSYYDPGSFDPADVDACRTERGGYGYWQGCGYGVCGASYQPLDACKPSNVQYNSFSGDLSVLDDDLLHGYPAIAWVDYGQHYVVVTGKNGVNYEINDPLFNRTEIYSGYIIHFVRYRGQIEPTATPQPPPPTPTPTPNPLWTNHLFIPALLRDSPAAPPQR